MIGFLKTMVESVIVRLRPVMTMPALFCVNQGASQKHLFWKLRAVDFLSLFGRYKLMLEKAFYPIMAPSL